MLLEHGVETEAKDNVSTVPPSFSLPSLLLLLLVAFVPSLSLLHPAYRARPFCLLLFVFSPAIPLLSPFSVCPLSLLPAPRFVPLCLQPASLFLMLWLQTEHDHIPCHHAFASLARSNGFQCRFFKFTLTLPSAPLRKNCK